MKKHALFFTLIAGTILCFGTISQAQTDTESVTATDDQRETVTVEDVQKETRELIEVLQKYTADQRDKAVKESKKALEKLDGRISELEERVDAEWEKMNLSARQKARANLKALRQQRNELAERYGSFKTSSSDAWEEMKKGFSEAYQAMNDSWEKAKAEYETKTQ